MTRVPRFSSSAPAGITNSLRKLAAVSTISLLGLSVVLPSSSAARSPRPTLLPGAVRAGSLRPQSAGPVPSGWLAVTNYYRALANLPAVTANATLSANNRLHAKWMVKNQTVEHGEGAGTPYYTPEGDNAGENSNIMSGSFGTTERSAVEGWITAPFHAIGILDPRLFGSGYGEYEERRNSGFEFASGLDVLNDWDFNPPPGTQYPIMFPAAGKKVFLDRYPGGEFPDPLTGCPGYTAPTGTPIYLQLAASAAVSTSSFKQGTTSLLHCVFDGSNYVNPDSGTQSTGRAVLSGRNAIVLIPKAPLKSNKAYDVSITVGGNPISWSFLVGDVTPPRSVITRPKHQKVLDQDDFKSVKGTASGDTQRVDIALAQYMESGKCKFKKATGFTSARSCGSVEWLKATGTANWSRALGSKLPPSTPASSPIGNYLMWSRSTDKVGNVERSFQLGRNYSAFHVKP